MSFFGFFSTATEKKRDDYLELRNELDKYIINHLNKINEIETVMNSYKGSIPKLSSDKIPSDDFEPKREQKTNELQKYIDYEKGMKADLNTARRIANEKYEYYKAKAEQEAAERAAAAKS